MLKYLILLQVKMLKRILLILLLLLANVTPVGPADKDKDELCNSMEFFWVTLKSLSIHIICRGDVFHPHTYYSTATEAVTSEHVVITSP